MIKINNIPGTDAYGVYYFECDYRGIPLYFITVGAKGQMIRNKYVEPGLNVKPFWVFSGADRVGGLLENLLDALVEFGVKSKKHPLPEQEVEAIKGHLADMRTIAFHQLGIGKGVNQ